MIRALALALLCAGSFAGVYWASAPDERAAAGPETVGSISPAAAPAASGIGPDAIPAVLRAGTQSPATGGTIRDVTPDTMTAAPRAADPGPPSPAPPAAEAVAQTASQPDAQPKQADLVRLFNPIVVSAGTIKTGNQEVHLEGVTATDPDRRCGEGQNAWPCGTLARTALRNFIHSRAVACEKAPGRDALRDPARCFVGNDDLGEWLVAQGWAEASGSAYAKLAKTARDGKLGIYSDARPDVQAADVATRP